MEPSGAWQPQRLCSSPARSKTGLESLRTFSQFSLPRQSNQPFTGCWTSWAAVFAATWFQIYRERRRGRQHGGVCCFGTRPQNLYELLRLSPMDVAFATKESLKQRQRAILRVCHPDIAGDGGAALTSVLTEAIDLLSTSGGRIKYEAMLQGDSLLNPSGPVEVMWPALGKIEFSKDAWKDVLEEERGEHHAAEDYLFVDEVACINCMICTEAAPNTFKIIDYPGGPDNCGNGWAARVHTQWGNGEELLWEATEYCPRGCIYWVPRAAVRTLEYVAQADEFQPTLGRKRKDRGSRSGQTNYDPVSGYQVWWPCDEGLAMFYSGNVCPDDGSAPISGEDSRLVAAWDELPTESQRKILENLEILTSESSESSDE